MGWLYMKSFDGHAGPRAYLDAQYTYQQPEGRVRVLRSALVKTRVYYGAIEQVRACGDREVYAMICPVRYNPRARDGYIFGYKDMHEAMGPCESQCPGPILDLLTASDNNQALAWRERCRTNIAARREQSAKPKPRPGQTIVFETPIAFRGGRVFERLEVAFYSSSHRTVVFRDSDGGGLYRVPNLKTLDYRLIDPPDR